MSQWMSQQMSQQTSQAVPSLCAWMHVLSRGDHGSGTVAAVHELVLVPYI